MVLVCFHGAVKYISFFINFASNSPINLKAQSISQIASKLKSPLFCLYTIATVWA